MPGGKAMDVDSYLKRIGVTRPSAPSAQALRTLTRAHLERVPFENLEIALAHRCPSMEPEDLFRKVVTEGRGGYCFELNKLFSLLLRELGYDCYCAAARIPYRRPDPRPLSHRVILVDTEEGRWLCDVGYGGPGPKGALRLASGVQVIAGERFSSREEGGVVTVCRHEEEGVDTLMSFRDIPVPEEDFEVLNGYWGYNPGSVFTRKLVLYRCLPDGVISLVGDQFTCRRQGKMEKTRKIADEGELSSVLRDGFGLSLPRAVGIE